ncbi:MAG: cytochrome b6 [Oligoflexia bacterium]|nr:MAG: cytochrome b6 [Oligoflexia bacterium]
MSQSATLNRPITSGLKIPNAILGILFFIFTELMFFTGLISAYFVGRANLAQWPPVGQPRFPVEATLINTMILLASAVTAWLATQESHPNRLKLDRARMWVQITLGLGSLFLLLQGYEWYQLIQYGLKAESNNYGAYFYLLVGAHGLHVFAGLLILLSQLAQISKIKTMPEKRSGLMASIFFWYFVVGLWPVLYVLVYML